MKDLDFSNEIRAKLYPIEEADDSVLAAERFGGKKRGALKDSDFIDPKRRSFPVMSCKDVKDAVSTWGMYKGPMSFDTFKSKLKARAKKLGCEGSLPKSWGEEADSGMKDGKADYNKVDKEEVKEDTKKQRKEHYKDAIKDEDLKKDEKIDKEKEAEAKTKKQWEKIDKKELDRDSKKDKEKHEKDAVKNDQDKINRLKKGKPSTKKSVETHDLKKDQEFDEEDKIKYKDRE